MKQITLAVALFISLFATLNSAAAQCNGNFGANSACGTVGGGLPGPIPFSSIISGGGQVVGPGTTTIGCAAPWANTTGTQLANNCAIQFVGSTLTLTFGTGSNSTIAAISTNTGFLNQFAVTNTGTVSNTGTQAIVYASLGGAYNVSMGAYGGATPYGEITSGASLAGLTISAGAGALTLVTPTVSGTANFTGTFEIGGNAMTFPAAAATLTQTIATGALALATGAIASGACTSAQTATATNALTTDTLSASFSADPTATTGYIPSTSGMLTIVFWLTANTANFKVCNNTATSITPGATTINWGVRR